MHISVFFPRDNGVVLCKAPIQWGFCKVPCTVGLHEVPRSSAQRELHKAPIQRGLYEATIEGSSYTQMHIVVFFLQIWQWCFKNPIENFEHREDFAKHLGPCTHMSTVHYFFYKCGRGLGQVPKFYLVVIA